MSELCHSLTLGQEGILFAFVDRKAQALGIYGSWFFIKIHVYLLVTSNLILTNSPFFCQI